MSNSNVKIVKVINELRKLEAETPCVEFKGNNSNPETIGNNISALSNAAALHSKEKAYKLWGIDDKTHEVIGTTFNPQTAKKGNESLELWLHKGMEPLVSFSFHRVQMDGYDVVLLEIEPANSAPVKFQGEAYIRIGANTRKLKESSNLEGELWNKFRTISFEELTALDDVDGETVISLLDCQKYFDMQQLPLPSKKGMLDSFLNNRIIAKSDTGLYKITNLGAILFAKKFSDFKNLARKAIRVIKYEGSNRTKTLLEIEFGMGYAFGFEALIGNINGLLPRNEVIGQALRKEVSMFPELAIRELVANAIIHQDFSIRGTSLMIEIFDGRMEITNPGVPLIAKERFVDSAPIARNEALAAFMRRIGICEERGSGYDKVIEKIEEYQLPAPEIEVSDKFTKITLDAHKSFSEMTKEERIWACYLHACLKRVSRAYATNSTLRERFNVSEKNSSMISRLIGEACAKELIKPADDGASLKNKKYLPFWA